MQYYVARNGQSYGPYTVAEMRDYLANGRVTYADQIRMAEGNEWVSAASVAELAGVLPPLPAPVVAPPKPVADGKQFRLKAVIRDVAIVFFLTAIGGFMVGVFIGLTKKQELFMPLIALSNMVLGVIGFAISGYLTPRNRWNHLAWVMLITWVASLINLLFGFSFAQWLAGGIFTVLMMLIGGGISFLFKRSQ